MTRASSITPAQLFFAEHAAVPAIVELRHDGSATVELLTGGGLGFRLTAPAVGRRYEELDVDELEADAVVRYAQHLHARNGRVDTAHLRRRAVAISFLGIAAAWHVRRASQSIRTSLRWPPKSSQQPIQHPEGGYP